MSKGNSPMQDFFPLAFNLKPKNKICSMSHLRLLLKFPIFHCTLQLPPVTSHHSKHSALNILNKWTLLPSAPFKGKMPSKPISWTALQGSPHFQYFIRASNFTGHNETKKIACTSQDQADTRGDASTTVPWHWLLGARSAPATAVSIRGHPKQPHCAQRSETSPCWTWVCL